MSDSAETLFEFPCRFPIKAMGRADSGLQSLLAEILARHAPGTDESAFSVRPSRNGNWVAVTVTIEAHSKPQLDAIYSELSAHRSVVWAL